jgi:hypothetical protein
MAHKKTQKPTTKNALLDDPRYLDLVEVAETAAYRINVAANLIADVKDRPLDEADDDGGWTLRTAIDVLTDVSNDLRNGAAADMARIKVRRDQAKLEVVR